MSTLREEIEDVHKIINCSFISPDKASATAVETFCFSLRNLPFRFRHSAFVELFFPIRSAESSLRVLQ